MQDAPACREGPKLEHLNEPPREPQRLAGHLPLTMSAVDHVYDAGFNRFEIGERQDD
jgi:hypothetical protein